MPSVLIMHIVVYDQQTRSMIKQSTIVIILSLSEEVWVAFLYFNCFYLLTVIQTTYNIQHTMNVEIKLTLKRYITHNA